MYVNQYNLWLEISAIIVLVSIYGIGVADGCDGGDGYMDVREYGIGVGDAHGDDDGYVDGLCG